MASIQKRLDAGATARVARAAGRRAHAAASHLWTERLLKLGFMVRGVIYLIPGAFALRLALGSGSPEAGEMTQTGAVEMIASQPYGRFLLIPVAAGLAGYALWGVIRAVLDPLRKGDSSTGILKRLGYAMSAIAVAGLFAATLRFALGTASRVEPGRDWTADLLARPYGVWLVGILGLCWISVAGILQIVAGWKGSIEKDLDLERMGHAERWWAVRLGRFGIVSRGVVLTIIGLMLVGAALRARPGVASGMDGALLELTHQPFGRALLAAVSLGLIAFGAFSVMCVRWMRLRAGQPGTHPSSSPSHSPKL